MDTSRQGYIGRGWPDGEPLKKRGGKRKKGGTRRAKIRGYLRQNGICFYCNLKMHFEECNVDHVTPRSKGGSHKFSNLVVCHIKCNDLKKDRMPTDDELLKLRELNGIFQY